MNKKTFYIVILFIIGSFLIAPVSFAETPVKYYFEVGIPGFNPDSVNGFGDLILVIIRWSYWLAVLFAFFKLIEVGFKYMTSKGNVNVVAFASKSFKDILIGMLILFGSYLILNTINPELTVIPNLSSINKVPGGLEIDSSSWSQGGTKVNKNNVSGALLVKGSYWWPSGDSSAAAKDIDEGKAKAEITMLINQLLNNKEWMPESCKEDLFEFGPITTGHLSDPSNPSNKLYKGPRGDGKSCHQTGHAVDLVMRKSKGDLDIACTLAVKLWIEKNTSKWETEYSLSDLGKGYTVCDETGPNYLQPHIHIESKNCPVGPSC